MKILGIDDNDDLLELCKTVLTFENHEYTGISDGKNGLKAIRDEKFDLVLLDLSMPDFTGEDVMNALIEENIMNKQKVVIFTALSPIKKEIEQFLEKGAHSIIKKPLDPDTLLEFVHKLESEV